MNLIIKKENGMLYITIPLMYVSLILSEIKSMLFRLNSDYPTLRKFAEQVDFEVRR